MTLSNITLHARRPSESISASRVYFAFASGRLTYDCVTCAARCCRGHGYITATGPELTRQLTVRPHLQFFLEDAAPSSITRVVRNCPPGCFFLTEDNLCGIHAEFGYGAKPETCRLFPFNQFLTVGDHLIVTPHPNLCPLAIVAPGKSDECSRHEALIDGMSAQGIAAGVPHLASRPDVIDAVIAHERAIVTLSERYLEDGDFTAFVVAQIELARTGADRAPADPNAPSASSAVDQFLQTCCKVLGLAGPLSTQPYRELDRLMIALTPYLRSTMLFEGLPGVTPSSVPEIHPDRLPYALLAIHVLAQLTRLSGMTRITFQTIGQLRAASRDLIALLRDVDRVMIWGQHANIDIANVTGPCAIPFIRIAKTLLPSAQARTHVPLGVLLCRHNPFEGAERGRFLRFVSARLAHRLVPLHHAPFDTRRADLSVRRRFQRWTLWALNEQSLRLAFNPQLATRMMRHWTARAGR